MPAPYPLEDTFSLHSYPGGSKRIYLDFDGFDSPHSDVYPPYDFDGNPAVFDEAERVEIQLIWMAVMEDFLPFEVDVTTEFPKHLWYCSADLRRFLATGPINDCKEDGRDTSMDRARPISGA